MQKARIITIAEQHATNFADQLRRRGYDVEIAHPDGIPLTDVDLEVQLEACSEREVFTRAAELATANDADIYVARDALGGSTEPVVEPLEMPSLADTFNGLSAGLQNKRDLMAKALREKRAMMRQARLAQQQTIPEPPTSPPASQPIVALAPEPQPLRRPLPTFVPAAVQATVPVSRRIRYSRDMRLVFAVSAVFAAVMMLGWLLVTRIPASPLSPALATSSQNVEQSAPFAIPVRKQALASETESPVPTGSAAVASHAAPPAPAAVPESSPERPLPRHPVLRDKARTTERHEFIAEDVVHYVNRRQSQPEPVASKPSAPATHHPAASQNASLKRISDE